MQGTKWRSCDWGPLRHTSWTSGYEFADCPLTAVATACNRYDRNKLTSRRKTPCESLQNADFVTPVTDWRSRFFLETYRCLQQRPVQPAFAVCHIGNNPTVTTGLNSERVE